MDSRFRENDRCLALEHVRTCVGDYFPSVVVAAANTDPVRESGALALRASGKRNALNGKMGGASTLSLLGMLLLR